jgi:hypothetical protein
MSEIENDAWKQHCTKRDAFLKELYELCKKYNAHFTPEECYEDENVAASICFSEPLNTFSGYDWVIDIVDIPEWFKQLAHKE